MTKTIFLSLPVKDLAASTRFYAAIGCQKNDQFSDDKASCMVWSETITFMLLTQDYFGTFIDKPVADTAKATGALIALSLDTREAVDAIVATAIANGGKGDHREARDMGFMYQRAFEDPNGHTFEPLWLNPEATFG